mmetsp:Transcript_6072/g.14846  ORF Transcript_6072/g.14846 Transcript_6072/m.14846 type:complete len:95 (+) Transcript_6072:3046-3330(+)
MTPHVGGLLKPKEKKKQYFYFCFFLFFFFSFVLVSKKRWGTSLSIPKNIGNLLHNGNNDVSCGSFFFRCSNLPKGKKKKKGKGENIDQTRCFFS